MALLLLVGRCSFFYPEERSVPFPPHYINSMLAQSHALKDPIRCVDVLLQGTAAADRRSDRIYQEAASL